MRLGRAEGKPVAGGLRRAAVCSLGLLFAGFATAGRAHHSISAVYDVRQRAEIEGVVVEFSFVNPHPFAVVTVGEGEEAQAWRLEFDNRFELVAIGITGETFRPGDRIVAAGTLGRRDPHALYVRRLDRPADGLRYEQVGMQPRLTRIP